MAPPAAAGFLVPLGAGPHLTFRACSPAAFAGAYDDEDAAARAHDLAALKYWGPGTVLNFPVRARLAPSFRNRSAEPPPNRALIDSEIAVQLTGYDEELREMEGQPREEYIGALRRRSSGFSRGVSKYRGVARYQAPPPPPLAMLRDRAGR